MRRSSISILLSIISILVTTGINIAIANEYIHSSGKNRALFGLTELLTFGYQYYVVILAGAAFIVSLFIKKLGSKQQFIALLLSVMAISLVFLRIWRVFVWIIPGEWVA